MEIINRSAILVKPAQPFLDWLYQVDPTSAHLKLDDLRLETTIYLLPECEGKEEEIECLREVCTEIFEEQLDGCYRVPLAWPGRTRPECVSDLVRVEPPFDDYRPRRRLYRTRGNLIMGGLPVSNELPDIWTLREQAMVCVRMPQRPATVSRTTSTK